MGIQTYCNKCDFGNRFGTINHSMECQSYFEETGKRIKGKIHFWNEKIKRWDFK